MKFDNYTRKGKVLRVVNGNTLDIEVDLGFNVKIVARVDLARLEAAEQFTEIGEKAKQDLNIQFHHVPDVTLTFDRHPNDRFRWIAEVWDDMGRNVSDLLLLNNSGKFDGTLVVQVLA
jgi:hypothetical protein